MASPNSPYFGDNPTPRYLQLAQLMRQRIARGQWPQGHRLPSLDELVQEFGVARVTVRQAVDMLARDGLLSPQQGRGTFVTGQASERWLSVQTSLESLGITVGPTDDGKGVQILSVDPNSAAADAGIKQGDRIAAVNNKDVSSGKDITSQLDAAKKEGRTKALFQVETDNGSRFVALPTDKG